MRLLDTQQDALITVFSTWSDTGRHDTVGAYRYVKPTDAFQSLVKRLTQYDITTLTSNPCPTHYTSTAGNLHCLRPANWMKNVADGSHVLRVFISRHCTADYKALMNDSKGLIKKLI